MCAGIYLNFSLVARSIDLSSMNWDFSGFTLSFSFPSCYGICSNRSNSPYCHRPGDVFLKKKDIRKNICKLGLLRYIHLPPSWLWIISLTPLSLSFHLKYRKSNTKTHLLYWMVMKLSYNNRCKKVLKYIKLSANTKAYYPAGRRQPSFSLVKIPLLGCTNYREVPWSPIATHPIISLAFLPPHKVALTH